MVDYLVHYWVQLMDLQLVASTVAYLAEMKDVLTAVYLVVSMVAMLAVLWVFSMERRWDPMLLKMWPYGYSYCLYQQQTRYLKCNKNYKIKRKNIKNNMIIGT